MEAEGEHSLHFTSKHTPILSSDSKLCFLGPRARRKREADVPIVTPVRNGPAMPGKCDISNANSPRPSLASAVALLAVMFGTLCSSVGCFDADALIEARRTVAMRTRLEEVDLGEFRVTLPHAAERTENAEIYFHVFGQVAHRNLEKVKKSIDKHGAEIRHRMLITARMMTAEQLEDPQLKDLRTIFAEVVNETLEGNPVQSVGFYRFGYMSF